MRILIAAAACLLAVGLRAQEVVWDSRGNAGLGAALRSPQGVADVQAAFDRAFSRAAVVVPGVPVPRIAGDPPGQGSITRAVVTPIIGGSCSLAGGKLLLMQRRESRVEILSALAAVAGDPAAARSLYDARSNEVEPVDALSRHILRRALDNMPNVTGPDADERRKLILGRTILSVIETAAETHDDMAWHVHPPAWTPQGWSDEDAAGVVDGGPEPTDADREGARNLGRGLLLVFHADGFDAIDLAPGGERVVYRSPAWRGHFAATHAALSR